MGYLDDLSLGLRQAAGVLNPQISRDTFAADERKQNLRESFAMSQMTPQAELARQQLENEIGFRREIGLSDGSPASVASAAMKYGKPELAVTLYNQQEQRRDRIAAQRDALAQRAQEFELRLADKALDRESRERISAMLDETKREGLRLTGLVAAGNQEIKRLGIEMMGDRERQKIERGNFQKVQQLGSAFEKAGLSQTDTVLRAAEAATADDAVLEYINGPKSSIPDLFVPQNITNARQSIARLFNITLKDRSGAAVTIPELERLKEEFGRGIFKKPEQLREAIKTARTIVENHYRGIAAGFGADSLNLYNQNMREIGGQEVLTAPALEDPLGIRR